MQAWTPRVLETVNRPRALSPDMEFALLRIRPSINVLRIAWEPKVLRFVNIKLYFDQLQLLSPPTRLHLLEVTSPVSVLTQSIGGSVLSPSIVTG